MPQLNVIPDVVAAAAVNLQDIGVSVNSASATAAARTTSIAAPAADEVSAAITGLFNASAQEFQDLNARAAVFHEQFAKLLGEGARRYASAEATNVQQTLENAINVQAQALLGHPLIGTGTGIAAANPAESLPGFPGTSTQSFFGGFISVTQESSGALPYGTHGNQLTVNSTVDMNILGLSLPIAHIHQYVAYDDVIRINQQSVTNTFGFGVKIESGPLNDQFVPSLVTPFDSWFSTPLPVFVPQEFRLPDS